MKKSALICFLSNFALGATSIPLLFTTTSCSELVLPENIHTHEQSLFAFEHTFDLKVVSDGIFPKETKITLINEGRELSITSVSFSNKEATVKMKISEAIHYDTAIKYALSFEYKDKYITVDDLSVLYVYQGEEERKDKVIVVDNIVQKVQERIFDFKFQFSALPKGPINPSIVGGSEYLSVPEGTYIVQKDPDTGLFFLDLPIKLSDGISIDRNFEFSLNFDFTNSFGEDQSVKIENLNCYFLTDKSLDIPSEYYVIDSAGVLHGFTDLIKNNPKLIQSFRRIVIPHNVTAISEDAFNISYPLRNITEIQFNQQVRSVGNHAFFGLTRLETVDFTKWDGQEATEGIPSWVYSDNNTEIFNLEKISFRKGFILIGNDRTIGNIKNKWADHLFTHGIGYKYPTSGIFSFCADWKYANWSVYHEDEVSPEGWFTTEPTSKGYKLTGLNRGTGGVNEANVVKCGLIKIPNYVTSISLPDTDDKSFKFFGSNPSTVDGITQRRLCLGPNVSYIDSSYAHGAFTQAGLYSYISIPQGMDWIASHTFYKADRGSDDKVGAKPISFCFYPSSEASYNKIADYAFADIYMDYINLPSSLDHKYGAAGDVGMGKRVFENSRIWYIDVSEFSEFPTEHFATKGGSDGTFAGLYGGEKDHERDFLVTSNGRLYWASEWITFFNNYGLREICDKDVGWSWNAIFYKISL